MPDNDALRKLLDAASQAAQPTAFGWQTLPARLAHTAQQQPRSLGRWATLPIGVSAAAVLFLIVWLGRFGPERVVASDLPIEVKQVQVDLTVLSVAETDGETLYMPILHRLGRRLMAMPGSGTPWRNLQEDLESFLRQDGAQPARKRTGQALVKDRRLVLNLKKGDNLVRFSDVAATIDPTSVRFESLTDPAGTTVVEQGFEYDLATADTLLGRSVDQEIVCIGTDGAETAGYLASFDAQTIVLVSEPSGKQRATQSLTRRSLRAVRLASLPEDLIVKPTLVWKLRTQTPGKHETILSYICGFVKWQADYVALVTPGTDKQPDLLDLNAWVTLENTSGSTYKDAGLRLIAGDVNRLKDPWAWRSPVPDILDQRAELVDGLVGSLALESVRRLREDQFVEQAFFEYRLYTLSLPTTVRDREIKQLQLFQKKGVKTTRRYVFDPELDSQRLAVELLAKNDKDNNLGVPLPKGRVAVEQRGSDGETAVLGRVEIDHTAVKEELALRYMFASDVVGEHKEASVEKLDKKRTRHDYEIRVRNHKNEPIAVRAFSERLPRGGKLTQANATFEQHDAQRYMFEFRLAANAERTIRYSVEFEE
jgi:hypothetical protein